MNALKLVQMYDEGYRDFAKQVRAPMADLEGIILKDANLTKANLKRANLLHVDLTNATLDTANLWGACLSHACLAGASLKDATLGRADLAYSDMSDADLSRAKLNGACLMEANLEGANLQEAYLYAASLDEAILDGADLRGATYAVPQLLRANWYELPPELEVEVMLWDALAHPVGVQAITRWATREDCNCPFRRVLQLTNFEEDGEPWLTLRGRRRTPKLTLWQLLEALAELRNVKLT